MGQRVNSRHDARKRPYHLSCTACGRQFTAKRNDAKFCRPACRKASSRAVEQLAALKIRIAVLESKYGDGGRG